MKRHLLLLLCLVAGRGAVAGPDRYALYPPHIPEPKIVEAAEPPAMQGNVSATGLNIFTELNTFNAGITVNNTVGIFNAGIQVTQIDGSPYLGSSTYPCTTAGIVAANTFLTTGGGSGGIIDGRGCHGTITATAGFSLGAGANNPVYLLLDTTTWNMSSFTITLGRNSGIQCLQVTQCIFNWTGDVDGIVTPSTATGGYSFVYGIQATNTALATASHAVIHFFDCPQCLISNVLVSFDSTVASAGIRVETDANSSQSYGTWGGRIQSITVQRGAGLSRSTNGIIDLDFKGISGQTDGDVSKWVVEGMHLEGGTIDIQIFCGSSNRFIGGDLQNGAPEINITGTGACASADNYFNVNLNGAGVAGSQGYAMDANSNFNRIEGNNSQNLVASTDAGSNNIIWLSTGSGGGTYNMGGAILNGNVHSLNMISGASQPAGVAGKDYILGDNSSGFIFANLNGANYHTIPTVEMGGCSMSAATTCTFSVSANHGFSSAPRGFASVSGAPGATAFSGSCAISGTTVTITANASNSLAWNCVLFGNFN